MAVLGHTSILAVQSAGSAHSSDSEGYAPPGEQQSVVTGFLEFSWLKHRILALGTLSPEVWQSLQDPLGNRVVLGELEHPAVAEGLGVC